MYSTLFSSLHIILIFLLIPKGCLGAMFTLVNKCDYTVWPGILSNAGSNGLETTGFQLQPSATRSIQSQPGWSGRFWGRTGCSFDPNTGTGSCVTGDCGSNQIECNGAGAAPPATLAEFTIASGAQDFYDVSLVDGYNLPMMVEPAGGSGACGSTGCVTDLNRMCPNELRAGEGQGCKSACEAFGSPEYCCSGAFGSPSTCQPSMYSQMFKNACPRSYSYAYDDATSTFTCSGADYTITFCPSRTSRKSSTDSSTPAVVIGGGLPSPASAADTASQPQDDLPGWLPSFAIGGTSSFTLHFNHIICLLSIFFMFAFFQL